MEKSLLKKRLIEIIKLQKDKDGWTNLIKVGKVLKEEGIDYKALGYEKLFHLVKENVDSLNYRIEKLSISNIIIYVKEKTSQEKAGFPLHL